MSGAIPDKLTNMKRLKVKGKDYYIRKTDVALILENHICNASFFNDVEVTFLCSMFDYEVVREYSKKYVIKSNGYFLCVGDMYDLSFRFCGESNKLEKLITFASKDECNMFLKNLKQFFPTIPDETIVVEV